MGIKVGIDLGTTFSAVARISPSTGRAEIIKNKYGESTTPSVIYVGDNGSILYGKAAKEMQECGEENAIAFFKRNMGNKDFSFEINGKRYNATDFSSILLKNLKKEAEEVSGEKIDSAVITVPAYFTDIERKATMEAAKMAGINVIAIINEPTAAAFAYGLNETASDQTILIYDLGGGTFDVTIAKINKDSIDVIGSDGDHALGGKDWDDCIAQYICEQFEERTGISFSDDAEMVNAILVKAETVKKQLSSMYKVKIPVDYDGKKEIIEIDQSIFESSSSFLMGTTMSVIDRLFESVKMNWSDIDGVILVGGSTRMKMVQNYIKEMSGKEPLHGVNVDEAVALGAAIRANLDTEPQSFLGGLLRGKKQEKMLTIAGAKKVKDVTAHSMGMISQNKAGDKYINSIIIPKNHTIPASESRTYQLSTRNALSEMEVYVVQGEYPRPLDNTISGLYVIKNIEKTGSSANIEVKYTYTANGIIEVSAIQKETKKSLKIVSEKVPDDMSWTDLDPREHMKSKGGIAGDVEVILCVDLSGSMFYPTARKPIVKATAAMLDFVEQMEPNQVKIGLMGFADRHKMVTVPTDDYKKLKKCIQEVESLAVGGGNSDQPFTEGYEYFKKSKADIKYLVVLTDGVWDYQDRAISEAKRCHKYGIEVIALGFGTADEEFLRKIASADDFATLTNLNELSTSFTKIAQEIGGSGKLKI